ncbi:hypothetical protein K438DRAFT_1810047 [Mycena galopus ATCC 62051]|nr:hypothetical protein K438DRAFT_1810047 [Mycena galopus ATCC 62051]
MPQCPPLLKQRSTPPVPKREACGSVSLPQNHQHPGLPPRRSSQPKNPDHRIQPGRRRKQLPPPKLFQREPLKPLSRIPPQRLRGVRPDAACPSLSQPCRTTR